MSRILHFLLSQCSRRLSLLPVPLAALIVLVGSTHSALATSTTISTNSSSAVTLNNNDSLTITTTGTLNIPSGNTVAVTTTGSNDTITNNGYLLQSGSGRAIRDTSPSANLQITNNVNAVIQTADNDAMQMQKASTSVILNNYGTITSLNASKGGAQAVDFNGVTSGSNTINNYSTGLIQALNADAVRPGVNGVVSNSGTMKCTVTTDTSSDGIDAQTNSGIQITNNTGGWIEGARHGITGGNTTTGVYSMSITNNAGGTIKGSDGAGINIDGINGSETVTVINNGTITGNGVDGDGDGVDVDGLINLTNTGLIKSINSFSASGTSVAQSEGVTVGGGTIINSGTIEGDVANGNTNAVGRGITLAGIDTTGTAEPIYANSTVTNQSGGLIKGQSDSAILVGGTRSGFTVTINNNSGATMMGSGSNAVIQTGEDNDTINNAGTIIANGTGKAIDMGKGTNALNITGGAASITGDISGGTGGTSSMTVDPGTGGTFSYAGSISNFNSVEFKSGRSILSGASTYTGTTSVSGGTLVVSGSLAGDVTVAAGATLGSGNNTVSKIGSLTVQSGASSGGTLSPGDSGGSGQTTIGQLQVSGSLTLGTAGAATAAHLKMEIGGTTGGIAYDQIALSGSLNLANVQLDLSLLGGFNPVLGKYDGNGNLISSGDKFALTLGATGISGQFTNQTSGDAYSGFNPTITINGTEFAIFYHGVGSTLDTTGGNDVVLMAVPEPKTWAMVVAGLGVLILSQRSRYRALRNRRVSA